jgi:hypothetical protein
MTHALVARARGFLRTLTIGVFFLLPSWPQASTGNINGTVRDQTRAVIPAAAVEVTNTSTNVMYRTTSNEAGFYMFPSLIPGRYRLSVDAPGMQRYEVEITVQVQQRSVIDPQLAPGQTLTTVEVRDVTPVTVADNPTLGHVLERQRIDQLPINGRNIQALFVTVPGNEGYRANGMPLNAKVFTLDGADITFRPWVGQPLNRPPSLDSLQEFKVETNNSSAKFLRPDTIIMSTKSGTNQAHGTLFETARNYGIGKARQRQDMWNNPPQLVRNEFGGTVGGPVVIPKAYDGRNKTFFFFAIEALRMRNAQTATAQVFTEEMRNGDFSNLRDGQGRLITLYDPLTTNSSAWTRQPLSYGGKLNVIDPKRLNPLTKTLYNEWPLPNVPSVNPLVGPNFIGVYGRRDDQRTLSTRLDHRFSEKDTFYGRFTQSKIDTLVQGDRNLVPTTSKTYNFVLQPTPNTSLALNWVHIFSPTFFNELSPSGTLSSVKTYAPQSDQMWADTYGLPNPFNIAGFPSILQGDSPSASYIFQIEKTDQRSNFLIVDDHATKITGKHEFQFGMHFRYDTLNGLLWREFGPGYLQYGATQASSLYDPTTSRTNPQATPLTGHAWANFYLGVATYQNKKQHGWDMIRGKETGLYFQDNWKVTSRLTLNLGLRWDYSPVVRDKNYMFAGFDKQKAAVVLGTDLDTMYRFGATYPNIVARMQELGMKFINWKDAGLPQNLVFANWRDYGPRLGFAYKTTGGSRPLVVRGGFRTAYYAIEPRMWQSRTSANPPFGFLLTNYQLSSAAQSPDGIANYGMRSVPTIFTGVNSRDAVTLNNTAALTPGINVGFFNPRQPTPRVHDWSLTLEKELMSNTLARVAWVGNSSTHQFQDSQINTAPNTYVYYMRTGQPLPTGALSGVVLRPYNARNNVTVFGNLQEWVQEGFGNYRGLQFEIERRYSKGIAFQAFYVVGNNFWTMTGDNTRTVLLPDSYLPGAVPEDWNARNRFLNYQRDSSLPKHRVRWNWIVDLPFGKGKPLGRNAGAFLDRIVGGWQLAGMGSFRSNYFTLPTSYYPNGDEIKIYGKQYPIQDCRSGACYPGYMWWNGYIPPNQINSRNAAGQPNGVMGVPAEYKPSGQYMIPWGSTAIPANAPANTAMSQFWDTNTVWIPLKDGSVQRTSYSPNLHPWQNQYLRGVGIWGLDASLFKSVSIREQVTLRFNADFFNVLNRPGNPNSIGGDGVLSTRNSGQGARELQLSLRLIW